MVTVPAPTGGPHANITFLIKGSDPLLKLASLGTGGAIQNSTTRIYTGLTQTVPADFVLSTDSAISSLMSWGIDFWDSTNGIIWVWVKIPSYSAGFTIYVSIGNSLITNYQGGSIGSEFSNTVANLHLPDGSSLALADFSGNSNSGTNHLVVAGAGKIDGAASGFNSGSAYFNLASSSSLNITGNITISAWVFLNATTDGVIISKATGGVDDPAYGLSVGTSFGNTNKISFQLSSAAFTTTKISDSVNAPTGSWIHVLGTWDGSTMYLYVNGTLVNSTAFAGPIYTNTQPLQVGGDPFGAGRWFLNGLIDEICVENAFSSADRIATRYSNQNNPPSISAFSPISGVGSYPMMLGIG